MEEQQEEYLQDVAVKNAMSQSGKLDQDTRTAQYYLEEQEKNLAESQLEVESIIAKIYHLLKQDVFRLNEKNKVMEWNPIEDEKQRALSDWGVDRIMQVVNFYVNKNTLLSNFDVEQINRIMLRFVVELNDLVLLKYKQLFKEPTFEECKEILEERIENRKKLRAFALEIAGKTPDEEEIKKELLEEAEATIEKEIQKIREEQRKEKLREYGLLMAQIESIVYSTFNRAYRGEERGSIRRHQNITELISPRSNQMPEKRRFFGWGGK